VRSSSMNVVKYQIFGAKQKNRGRQFEQNYVRYNSGVYIVPFSNCAVDYRS